ncbi:MAG: hypothetical protein IJU95_05300 [Treponema sp.]|nr:hypothetical protein [Treponema sp.]
MKRTVWKTVALLAALALSASLASGKPKKSGKKSAKDSGEAAAALKTATEDFVSASASSALRRTRRLLPGRSRFSGLKRIFTA